MPTAVQATSVTKSYQLGSEQVHALNNVSLTVSSGEMVAIVGAEGSGKSTLLHILGCRQRPDSGVVLIDGEDVTQLDDIGLVRIRVQKVGFLFQAFNLLANETALTNVEVPLRRQGIRFEEYRRRAEEALGFVGLGDHMDKTPGQLNVLQRQSVAIARAVAQDPAVIFADEPTQDMDAASRDGVMGLFQRLNEQGKTIVIAVPEQSGVTDYCRRVVGIAQGGTVDDDLVSERRVIGSSAIATGAHVVVEGQEERVCARCSYGNSKEQETCGRCQFPLDLTEEEEQSIEGRVSGADSRWQGIESVSDEGELPGQSLIDELKEIPVFSQLGSRTLVKVIPALEQKRFPGGQTIVRQGDAGDSFYVIRSGEVQVVLERSGSQDVDVAKLGAGEGFGEMALLMEQPRAANVVAATDVEAWKLSKSAFDELLSENLSMRVYFNRILVQRLSELQAKIVP